MVAGPPSNEHCLKLLKLAFPGIDDQRLLPLLDCEGWNSYEPGQTIEPNFATLKIQLIVDGCLAWGETKSPDSFQLPNPHFRGELLGEWSALMPERAAYHQSLAEKSPFGTKIVMSLMPTVLKELNFERFQKELQQLDFVKVMTERTFSKMGMINRMLNLQAANEKEVILARYLIFFLNHLDAEVIEGAPAIKMTQENISRLTCLSRKYVGNFLRQWEEKNIVECHNSLVFILNIEELFKVARIDDAIRKSQFNDKSLY